MALLVKSSFIPDSCIQGSELPIHVIWEGNARITVHCPLDLISLTEIYNVKEGGFISNKNEVQITGFETEGYLGLVFQTRVYMTPEVNIELIIDLTDDLGHTKTIEGKVLIFRQDIVKLEQPKRIKLIPSKQEIDLEGKVIVKNEGRGTAIVNFALTDKSDIQLKLPQDIEGFTKNFCRILSEKSNEITKNFPAYSSVINPFIDFIINATQGKISINEKTTKQIAYFQETLVKSIEENEDFGDALFEALAIAYISSVYLITELHGFLEYLKSLAANKIILLNAMSMLEIKSGINTIAGQLELTDLNSNNYSPIRIDLEIESNFKKTVLIPLYSIFDWGG